MPAASPACYHCHEPVPVGVRLVAHVAGADQPVCCIGCRGAAEWIQGLGLDDYYRLRSEPAARAADLADFSAWDRAELARLHVRCSGDDRAEVSVLVEGLRCAACAWLIERALGSQAGVVEVGVNAAARRVQLRYDPRATALSSLLQALARLGYVAHPLDAAAIDSVRRNENRTALKRLVVAGLGAMQAMMYGVALYAGVFDGIDPAVRDFFRWLGLLVATPVVLYAATPFFTGALREWRSRHLSMDTPVALAIALIYVASIVATLRGDGEIYFDSVSMFVSFLLLGRYVELRARHRSGDVVDALARLQPACAERRTGDGHETVGVHELLVGDVVRVAAGAAIPADGSLLSAQCRVDESLLSGESTPRLRRHGEAVTGGSIALDGPVDIEVRGIGADSVLAGIVRLIGRAGMQRPKLAMAADARATHFVLRVLCVTVLTALAWLWIDPSRAFESALAVLVVSCPCAFALAVPAALTRTVSVLARRGVLVVEADALEVLARADRFVFDKTGTLTEPGIDVAAIDVRRGSRDEALALAAALEQGNSHPLARAFRQAAAGLVLPEVGALEQVAGSGVSGCIDGRRLRLGRAGFVQPGTLCGGNALLLADDDGEIARFPLQERLAVDAAACVNALAADAACCEILSGDHPNRVHAIARRLGIGEWRAAASAADKLARIARLQGDGHVVAMVGDGINDAPVLAGADVAIAVGGGAALAHASSGILLADNRLDTLVSTRALARQMLRTLHRNLRWALVYNLSAVPLAAIGLVPPWLAAIGMSASSLVVILHTQVIGRERSDGIAAVAAPPATAKPVVA